MNTNIKYIYPVTRVDSIDRLLRTTAHNAYFVVTPLLTTEEEEERAEMKPEMVFCPNLEMTRRTRQHRQNQRQLLSHTTSSAKAREEEEEKKRGTPLVLHGIILRSQLVALLKHKVFFREENGVRGD